MIYWCSFLLMKVLNLIYFNATFIGRENLPVGRSFIIASNHVSNMDPFMIGISQWRRFSYMAKDDLFNTALSRMYWHGVGAFPIKRDTSDFRAMREALRRLKNGCPLIMFPEGTRGTGGRVKKVQAGVGFIAAKSRVPVVPVYLKGTDHALPANARWFRRHKVTVTIGEPIEFPANQSLISIATEIMDKIYELKS